MKLIADLQIHSKYARATSNKLSMPYVYSWAQRKGIQLMATGDWTHPLWIREIKNDLEEDGSGFLKLKKEVKNKAFNSEFFGETLFMLGTELSSIYTQGGKGRRIHTLIWSPSLKTADKIISELNKRGCNLASDGRPIIGLTSMEIAELVLSIDEKCLIIPAHCLLPDTFIHTYFNIKNIDQIKKGDKVLTHKGHFKKVKKLYKRLYSDQVYKIKPWYFNLGLTATDEHPFLTVKTVKKCRSTGDICRPVGKHIKHCRAKHYQNYKKEWVQSKNLEVGDFILYPRLNVEKEIHSVKISDYVKEAVIENNCVTLLANRVNKIPNKIVIDKDFCRLIGYYLAEGYVDKKGGISFAFADKERVYVEDVKKLMKKVFSLQLPREYERKNSSGIEVIYYSKIVAFFLEEFCYQQKGRYSASFKKLPEFFIMLPKSLQVEIVRGWWRGDRGYTSSRVLMNQLKTIFLRLGIIPSIYVDTSEAHLKRGNHKLKNRTIQAKVDNFLLTRLSFFEDEFGLLKEQEFSQFKTKLDRRHGFMDKHYVYLPIRKIEKELYQGFVYNLEVSDDNSYTSEFACVHNCWTPWFSLYGSKSGFDSIEECFGEYAKYIYAIETGLSSDPVMNWRIGDLDNRAILSFSDAHSGPKIGREATVFNLKEITYEALREAIIKRTVLSNSKGLSFKENFISGTIEFYPEEGKYHYTGHRNCRVRQDPKETREKGTVCHVCGRPLTIGVMHRVEELATRDIEPVEKIIAGVRWMYHPENKKPPYVNLVPLMEIIAEAEGSSVTSQKVIGVYEGLTENLAAEFEILLKTPFDKIAKVGSQRIAEAVKKVRAGKIVVDPGYDGVFGVVKIWNGEEEESSETEEEKKEQMSLF